MDKTVLVAARILVSHLCESSERDALWGHPNGVVAARSGLTHEDRFAVLHEDHVDLAVADRENVARANLLAFVVDAWSHERHWVFLPNLIGSYVFSCTHRRHQKHHAQ